MSTEAKPRGRRRSGRRPGASGTREAIQVAAGRQFAEHGYDRASMRAIAAAAGVDQKLIAYFFGSKQGLFVATVGLPFNPAETIPALLAGDRATLGERIAALLTDVLEQPKLHQRLTAVVRAAAGDPANARMMREFLTHELFVPAAAVLGGDDAILRLNLAGSQVVGMITARFIVGTEPLASVPPAQLAEMVAATLERYLTAPLGLTR